MKTPRLLTLFFLLTLAFILQPSAFPQPTPVAPASQAEVNAGVLRTKYVSPATLIGWPGTTNPASSQSPWLVDINGDGHSLTNVGFIYQTNTAKTNIFAGLIKGLGGVTTGSGAVALGANNLAGQYALTMGVGNAAYAGQSLVVGRSNIIYSGSDGSIAGGWLNRMQGSTNEFVSGSGNLVGGANSAAIGRGHLFDNTADDSIALGQYVSFITVTSSNNFGWSDHTGLTVTRSNSFNVNATGGSWFSGGPIHGDGSGLTGIPSGSIFPLTRDADFGGYRATNLLSVQVGGDDPAAAIYVETDADPVGDSFGLRSSITVDTPGTTETAQHYAGTLSQVILPAANSTAQPAWIAGAYNYFRGDSSAKVVEASAEANVITLGSSGVVTNLYGSVSKTALTGTARVDKLHHYHAAATTTEGGNTLTEEVGFYAGNFTTATTPYAFYSAGPRSHFTAADFAGDVFTSSTYQFTSDGNGQGKPAFGFGFETNSGMFRPSSGVLAFSVGGVEQMRMDAATLTVSNITDIKNSLTVGGTTTHNDDVLAGANNSYDVGKTGTRFRNGWFSSTLNAPSVAADSAYFSNIEGPLQIWNDLYHTNGSYSYAGGQIHSNANGNIRFSGGNQTNTGYLVLTNTSSASPSGGTGLRLYGGSNGVNANVITAATNGVETFTVTQAGAVNAALAISVANAVLLQTDRLKFNSAGALIDAAFSGDSLTILAGASLIVKLRANTAGIPVQLGPNALWPIIFPSTNATGSVLTLSNSVAVPSTATATNGFASFATGQALTLGATGVSNSTAIAYRVFLTAATGLSMTNSGGTAIFTGQAIAALTQITLQPKEQLVGTAMTYATGAGHNAW
jgi:hypothetical protein